MPVILIVFLTLIIIGLLIVLRKLKNENAELKLKVAEDLEFLQQMRTKDPLTQVLSRQHFMPLVEQEFQRGKRNQQPMSLIACDLDLFQQYNEAYGQIVGDECLYGIAQVIDRNVKRAGECVCRMGSEEFWILLPNVTETKAIGLAKIIQEQVRKLAIPYEGSPIAPYVTVSMGIVSFIPTAEDDLSVWLRSVEIAAAKAVEEGGDRYHVAS
ncbi:diguanylate cyclase [[Limnothrix rosea] IAM M-220]|uniref:diguanylate cyclase n=1 Tax=[Limnothrix rosea] IAM M-220 TaxID=454133 RepID=UPI0009594728|nr:diguanylate cyclase [[Limnothrix rosea] IAM M-220]OKH17077.1 hypothetical protein NIES208_10810 [[Limnothrix rosea] IAM M-220]